MHTFTCMPISLIESVLLSVLYGKGMTHLFVYLLFLKVKYFEMLIEDQFLVEILLY